jgi:hypothetical protein
MLARPKQKLSYKQYTCIIMSHFQAPYLCRNVHALSLIGRGGHTIELYKHNINLYLDFLRLAPTKGIIVKTEEKNLY